MTLYRINTAMRAYLSPIRSAAYLRFLREFPCCVCGSRRRVEAAHTGPHGIGTKASDSQAIPLCRACHRTGPRAYHKLGPGRFQLATGRDLARLVAMFQHFWFLRTGEKIEPGEERKAA